MNGTNEYHRESQCDLFQDTQTPASVYVLHDWMNSFYSFIYWCLGN